MNTAKEFKYVFTNSNGNRIVIRTHQTNEGGGVTATIEKTTNGAKAEFIGPVIREGLPYVEADFVTWAVANKYSVEKFTGNNEKLAINSVVTFIVTDSNGVVAGASVVLDGGSAVLTDANGKAEINHAIGTGLAYSVAKTLYTTVNGTVNVNGATTVAVTIVLA